MLKIDKKIEQLCQSDIINTSNILHIIDSIDLEIMEHQFKIAFYNELLDENYNIDFSDEFDRVVNSLREKNAESFQALLVVQGKNKDDKKELSSLIEGLVVHRFQTLMDEGYLTYLHNGKVNLKTMDSKTLKLVYGLIHTLQHEERREGTEKVMKNMMDIMAKTSSDIFGTDVNMDLNKLFTNNTNGKIDLSKILGTEKEEEDKKDNE